MSDKQVEESRLRQILGGGAVILLIGMTAVAMLAGWRHIPGWGGEGVGMLAGLISTPFLMEASFIIIGFITVVGLNGRRRRKEGDEFVTMEIPDAPEDGKNS